MRNYYVAKNGLDDNPGTEDEPWVTIQKAANTLIAGDTVYTKEGIYNERVIPQHSGSPGNYITYTAYPGHTVTIDGTGIPIPSSAGLFQITDISHIDMSGLRILNSAYWGIAIRNHSSNIIIENNYIHNCQSSGINVLPDWTYSFSINNITIDNNEVSKVCMNMDQEGISLILVDGFEIKNNHLYNCNKEGIDAKVGCSNGKIYKNHVHDIARIGVYVDSVWAKYNSHDIDIYQNNVHNCIGGIELATESGGTMDNIKVYNNLAYNNQSAGFAIRPYTKDGTHLKNNISVINNTFWNNGIGMQLHELGERLINFNIRNNIISKSPTLINIPHYASMPGLSIDHNLFFDGSATTYGDNYIIEDPKFVNPAMADFHLQLQSPAINAGSPIDAPSYDYDWIRRPVGTEYDIGAYEYALIGTIHGIVIDENGLPFQGVIIFADGYETATE